MTELINMNDCWWKKKFYELKHNIKWHTGLGDAYRALTTYLGFKLLTIGRKLMKSGMGRCSWCGAKCGMNSTVSKKGLRCSSLNNDCTDKPAA